SVTPPSGQTTTLDLDAVSICFSQDSGIVASRAWSGDLGGTYTNLSAAVKAVYDSARSSVANFTVRNGTINQGQGSGANSSTYNFEYASGFTVDGVVSNITGIDTGSVDASYATGAMVVRNSTFLANVDNVTNRMYGPSAIAFGAT